MVQAKVAIAVGAILWALWGRGKKEAPKTAEVAPPEPEPVPVKPPRLGAAELSNGNFARFVGDLDSGTYVRCESASGDELGDKSCALVLQEWPEIEVPITSKIRMTEGSRNL